MRSALVTGATGYLGAILAGRLLAGRVATHVLVRPTSDRSRLPDTAPALAVHVHDGSTSELVRILEDVRPDVVFHLATTYRRAHASTDVEPLIRANVEFGTQLLEAMRVTGARKVVNTGSYFQRYEGLRALNLYAATKEAFEAILAYYADAHGLLTATLMLYDVYGPGDPRAKLMRAIRDAALTGAPLPLPDCDPVIDLVYVDDVADAFVQAGELLHRRPAEVTGRQFALGSGERCRLSELVDLFEEVAGRPVQRDWGSFAVPPRRIDDPWRGDPLPGWRPAVPLREGISRMLAAA